MYNAFLRTFIIIIIIIIIIKTGYRNERTLYQTESGSKDLAAHSHQPPIHTHTPSYQWRPVVCAGSKSCRREDEICEQEFHLHAVN